MEDQFLASIATLGMAVQFAGTEHESRAQQQPRRRQEEPREEHATDSKKVDRETAGPPDHRAE